MDRWKSVLALTVAGALMAGTAFAQATTPAPSDKSTTGTTGATGESMMKKSGKGAMSEQVKAAQQALKDKGHDPGSIDGVMGPKTRQALKDFQKAEGIKETGRLDAETMAKLGVEGRTGAKVGSSPAASPRTDTGTSTGAPGQKK